MHDGGAVVAQGKRNDPCDDNRCCTMHTPKEIHARRTGGAVVNACVAVAMIVRCNVRCGGSDGEEGT